MASAPTLAMSRVVGSLMTVLTAKDEDAASAMLASWVSQVRVCADATCSRGMHTRTYITDGSIRGIGQRALACHWHACGSQGNVR